MLLLSRTDGIEASRYNGVVIRERVLAAALFLGVFLVYIFSPNATPFDSRWTVHTALSLLHERNADLNEYLPLLKRDRFYGIECLLPDGRRLFPVSSVEQCAGGSLYNFYPVAVPLLVSPLVGALEWGLKIAQPWLAPLAPQMRTAVRRQLLQGDLVSSSSGVELLLASLIVALAAVVVFLVARQMTGLPLALAVALVFSFATPAWSTGSRALWMHGFSMLLLPLGLWAILRQKWAAAGAVLALAFFVRPTNAVPLAFAGVWALAESRRVALRFALGALPVALVFVGINYATYGTLLAPFFFAQRPGTASLGLHSRLGEALLGNLVSPSRGLFVYSPIFLFSLYGVWRWLRHPPQRRLGLFLGAVMLGHYLLISSYEDWFGGHSYGPRYFSDLSSYFTLALVPAWQAMRRAARLLAMPALAVSLFMHAQGAWCWPCLAWNTQPVQIRESEWRLWDWSDPPFLRNFRGSAPAAE